MSTRIASIRILNYSTIQTRIKLLSLPGSSLAELPGPSLQLDSGATVKFNGEMLPFNNLLFGHSKEYAGRLNAGTFVYTNVDGKIFTNTLAAIDTIAFPASLDTVPKSAAYNFSLGRHSITARRNRWNLYRQLDLGAGCTLSFRMQTGQPILFWVKRSFQHFLLALLPFTWSVQFTKNLLKKQPLEA